MTEWPIACTLTPETLKAKRAELLPGLFARADAREPLPCGYRVRFPAEGDTLTAIVATVEAARQCCRFLRFQITVEPDGGLIWLEVTGPEGTREFLDGLVAQ